MASNELCISRRIPLSSFSDSSRLCGDTSPCLEFIPSLGEWDVTLRQVAFIEPKSWWNAVFRTVDGDVLKIPHNSRCTYRAVAQSVKGRLEHQITIDYQGHTYFVSSFGSVPVTILTTNP